MSNNLTTTTADMNAAANHVKQVSEDVSAQLNALHAKIANVEGAWRGQAKGAFGSLISRWDAEAVKLNTALSAISDAIRESGRKYDGAEVANASSLNNVGGLLNMS
ncbi:WXG100 family type VII secretion target [Lolliginicoccus levis]|uniref:WXG100 family type VII secretion target n=1 Tax=Lolliginicoccus levis TaxID=2919542 RepID=UPI00241F0D77|nr:WXG100 family type VII secretion target [Lolliginicoccus levis]